MESVGVNGYFQIIVQGNETVLRLYPSRSGGEQIDISELISYLDTNKIQTNDIKEINDAIINVEDEPVDIILPSQEIFAIHETMNFKISDDKMSVIARFIPASSNGDRLTKDEVLRTLRGSKVVSGFLEEDIINQLKSPKYCTDIIVAKGTDYVEGRDGEIKYNFEIDHDPRPKRNDDGTVDFHQLDIMNHVKEGELIATLIREDPGQPGLDVYGNIIKPPKVVRKILRFGKNIKLSEDETQIFSLVNGHVKLENDRIYVYNVFEVAADVDLTTGDIEYDGNVLIKGNIRTGFKVTASGNIEVNGVVEGAVVKSGGDVVLKRGIQGMNKGVIVAKGNIISKFIESATVVSEGFIETEAVLHSRMSAKGDIRVQGSKGVLIGGFTRSMCLIEAKVIGTPMGTTTNIEVGVDPELQDKIYKYKTDIDNKTKELIRLKDLFNVYKSKKEKGKLDYSQVSMMNKTVESIQEVNAKVIKLQEEYEKLQAQFKKNTNAKIVGKTLYPGVKLVISGEPYFVNSEIYMTQFTNKNGEIKQVTI